MCPEVDFCRIFDSSFTYLTSLHVNNINTTISTPGKVKTVPDQGYIDFLFLIFSFQGIRQKVVSPMP